MRRTSYSRSSRDLVEQGEDCRSRTALLMANRWSALEELRRSWFSLHRISPGLGGSVGQIVRNLLTNPWGSGGRVTSSLGKGYEPRSWASDQLVALRSRKSTMTKDATGQRTEDRGQKGKTKERQRTEEKG